MRRQKERRPLFRVSRKWRRLAVESNQPTDEGPSAEESVCERYRNMRVIPAGRKQRRTDPTRSGNKQRYQQTYRPGSCSWPSCQKAGASVLPGERVFELWCAKIFEESQYLNGVKTSLIQHLLSLLTCWSQGRESNRRSQDGSDCYPNLHCGTQVLMWRLKFRWVWTQNNQISDFL